MFSKARGTLISLMTIFAVIGACGPKPFASFDIPIDPSFVENRSLNLLGEVTSTSIDGDKVTISVIDHENYDQKNRIGSVVLTKDRPEGEIQGSYDRQNIAAVCKSDIAVGVRRIREICSTKINGRPWKTIVFEGKTTSSDEKKNLQWKGGY